MLGHSGKANEIRRGTWLSLVGRVATAAAVFLLTSLLVFSAYASDDSEVVLVYDPQENPVADRTVHINVNKLDRDTHEYVIGAHLQIIDKETGQVMADWVSDGTTQESARELDIDRNYILHEVSAPEGYEVAEDVEFILRSVNFETKGEVISGGETADGEANAEFNNVAGDIETQAFVISLFDKQSATEQTITEHRQRTAHTDDSSSTSKKTDTTSQNENETSEGRRGTGSLTQTGDSTSYLPIVLVGIVGVAVLVVGIIKKNKK